MLFFHTLDIHEGDRYVHPPADNHSLGQLDGVDSQLREFSSKTARYRKLGDRPKRTESGRYLDTGQKEILTWRLGCEKWEGLARIRKSRPPVTSYANVCNSRNDGRAIEKIRACSLNACVDGKKVGT